MHNICKVSSTVTTTINVFILLFLYYCSLIRTCFSAFPSLVLENDGTVPLCCYNDGYSEWDVRYDRGRNVLRHIMFLGSCLKPICTGRSIKVIKYSE